MCDHIYPVTFAMIFYWIEASHGPAIFKVGGDDIKMWTVEGRNNKVHLRICLTKNLIPKNLAENLLLFDHITFSSFSSYCSLDLGWVHSGNFPYLPRQDDIILKFTYLTFGTSCNIRWFLLGYYSKTILIFIPVTLLVDMYQDLPMKTESNYIQHVFFSRYLNDLYFLVKMSFFPFLEQMWIICF